jgi:hypothetical protein
MLLAMGVVGVVAGFAVLAGRLGAKGIPHQNFDGWALVLSGAVLMVLSLRPTAPTKRE